MAQRLQVLRCAQCQVFQVQIVKKSSNKWACKLCTTKQSVQQVFGEGSGKECRLIVQTLNAARGKKIEREQAKTFTNALQSEFEDDLDFPENSSTPTEEISSLHSALSVVPSKESKWAKYTEETSNEFLCK